MEQHFGEPVQILKLNSRTRKYELIDSELKEILLDEKIKDVDLAVISIAGAFRKGKSFLLSFLLRYVSFFYRENSNTMDNTNWLGNNHNKLSGFKWKSGSERITTGIWIWSKIFTKTMPNGKRIGIILMDTQGQFDSESTMHSNVTIFALSTMISSIQIYNLFNNIQEDDLQHLQLFTEYGRIAKENSDDSYKPFQQLMFLVRDWNFPTEYAYGLNGGLEKLENFLKLKSNQPPEIQSVRNHLRSSFEEITCCLMPSPGEKIRTKNNFDGRVSDIAPDFLDHLKELIPFLLKPENIMINGIKQVCGASVKPHQFYNLIEQYWKVFKNGKLPEVKTILTATTEAACLSAKSDIAEWYFKSMTKFTEWNDTSTAQLINIHNNLCTEALKKYDNCVVMGDHGTRNYYRQELKKCLEQRVNYFLATQQYKRDNTLNLNDTVNKSGNTLERSVKTLMHEIADLRARDNTSEIFVTLHKELQEFMKMSHMQQMTLIESMGKAYSNPINNKNNNNNPTDERSGVNFQFGVKLQKQCSIM